MKNTEQFQPDWATHPGEHLQEYLEILGWTRPDAALRIGIEAQRIDGILSKEEPVTPYIALLLEQALGLKADIWLKLQQRWDRMHPGASPTPYPPTD